MIILLHLSEDNGYPKTRAQCDYKFQKKFVQLT